MPVHNETQILPYTPAQLFDLVADIERYPEFLPWCRAARVLERTDDGMLAELVIAFNHLSERYTSRVTLSRPNAGGEGSIDVALVKGPFERLSNRWQFIPQGDGCELRFALDFAFRSRILEKLIGAVFTKATAKMVTAFRERAQALYGQP